MSYAVCSAALKLTGSMPIGQLEAVKLVVWPDADLAGDKRSSKATGGYWVELQCGSTPGLLPGSRSGKLRRLSRQR
eukprot:422268-Heterocapsa_arctica.AAC.1